MHAKQIPLQFSRFDQRSMDDFVFADGTEIADALKLLLDGNAQLPVFLWGLQGSGKSHLLQAACEGVSHKGWQAAYLPLKDHAELSPSMFDGLEMLDLVCVDDVQAIAGQPEWEQALFHLYNRIRESHCRLLMSALNAPSGLDIVLADLKSRLGWGLVMQLPELGEDELVRAMQSRSERRGFELSKEVIAYLLSRCPRDTDSLFRILDQIDSASLSAKRKVTIPFVREMLSD